jgi:hypothetical protein
MRIAVIDSGIDPTHPRLKDCKISGISIIARNKTYVLGDDFNRPVNSKKVKTKGI